MEAQLYEVRTRSRGSVRSALLNIPRPTFQCRRNALRTVLSNATDEKDMFILFTLSYS